MSVGGAAQTVGWTVNTAANGLTVNGNDVTAYGHGGPSDVVTYP